MPGESKKLGRSAWEGVSEKAEEVLSRSFRPLSRAFGKGKENKI